jgi:ATP-dependent DNA helicase RecQ
MNVAVPPECHEILHRTFGYPAFRGQQEAVIGRVMAGAHTLALMPTGAGKSLCYQIPALARSGTAIVISPLIALMHDQIRSATAAGIRAASMTSADSDNAATAEAFRSGGLDLLYVAPERASTAGFHSLLERAEVSLFAIDEAHCVSEWGHDFRRDYRMLRPVLDRFPQVPRLALTATADRATRADILVQLGIPDEGLIVAGFDRPNIRYAITPRDIGPRQITELLQRLDGAGIVYAPSRKQAEDLAAAITRAGREAGFYHAGLEPERRARVQSEFVASESMVMVATIAFGMGIDKPDVRFVAHLDLPKNIEAYYQETGRAGRDGLPANAWMVYGLQDVVNQRRMIDTSEVASEEFKQVMRGKLDALLTLAEDTHCRRVSLLRYFGEDSQPCMNCDNCLMPPAVWDATDAARKMLSCIYRVQQASGISFGAGHIMDILRGKATDKVAQYAHNKLSTFGIGADLAEAQWRGVLRQLIAKNMVRVDSEAFSTLELLPDARAVLRGEVSLMLREQAGGVARKKRSSKPTKTSVKGMAEASLNAGALERLGRLKAWRAEVAREHNLPAFVIFHDATLRAIADKAPQDLADLEGISGMGSKKLHAYGAEVIRVCTALA